MRRLTTIFILISSSLPVLYAGKWDSAARLVGSAIREPERALDLVGFLIDLFLMCIPVAIVAGIASIILKSVFDMDKEDTQKSFFIIGGILLAICLLVYFFV